MGARPEPGDGTRDDARRFPQPIATRKVELGDHVQDQQRRRAGCTRGFKCFHG